MTGIDCCFIIHSSFYAFVLSCLWVFLTGTVAGSIEDFREDFRQLCRLIIDSWFIRRGWSVPHVVRNYIAGPLGFSGIGIPLGFGALNSLSLLAQEF